MRSWWSAKWWVRKLEAVEVVRGGWEALMKLKALMIWRLKNMDLL